MNRVEQDSVLITVGLSWNTNPSSMRKRIIREICTASNIKSKNTRKKVIKALKRIMRVDMHPNMMIFAAYDCIWTVVPEVPLTKNHYWCGKTFRTDFIQTNIKAVYIADISIKEATLKKRLGDYLEVLEHITSGIPSQHGKGGQSQQRFLRKHQQAIKAFSKRVKVKMNSYDVQWEVNSTISLE